MKQFISLTKKEKIRFTKEFYSIWEKELAIPPDTEEGNPFPWGMPWAFVPCFTAVTPAEWLADNKDVILYLRRNTNA